MDRLKKYLSQVEIASKIKNIFLKKPDPILESVREIEKNLEELVRMQRSKHISGLKEQIEENQKIYPLDEG